MRRLLCAVLAFVVLGLWATALWDKAAAFAGGVESTRAEVTFVPKGPTMVPDIGLRFVTGSGDVINTTTEDYDHESPLSAGQSLDVVYARSDPSQAAEEGHVPSLLLPVLCSIAALVSGWLAFRFGREVRRLRRDSLGAA